MSLYREKDLSFGWTSASFIIAAINAPGDMADLAGY